MNKDSAILVDGSRFDFWDKEVRYVKELFVDGGSASAADDNDGSREHPFKTIQAAARVATAGTHVWIMPGEYRECVSPMHGGDGPESMVCYEAVEKGTVVIKASEQVTEFEPTTDWQLTGRFGSEPSADVSVWCHRLDPEMFKGYNPFCAVNIIHDRLFIEYDKTDMTPYLNRRGMVFCDGKPLEQVPLSNDLGSKPGTYWVEANGMAVHFRLPGDDNPKNHLIEISVREQCFAAEKPFLSYIKVKGLVCAHATMGAPIPQRGAISAHRGHHWVIEDCKVLWSNATGIDIGNEDWHHKFDFEQTVGYSVIRRCDIIDAGVCGIAGLYAQGMLIEDCLIEGTGWQKMELSWEAGGIKLHNSVNGLFRRNVFRNTFRADCIWLDCGNVNNRITENLFLNGIEQREAIFIECTKDGVNLIDNNIFWNIEGRFDKNKIPVEPGSSGWYKLSEHEVVNGYAVYGEGTDRMRVENNFIGKCRSAGYFAKPVPFRISGRERGGTSRDAKFFNNIFYACGEAAIKMPTEKNESEGNLYVKMPGGYLRILYPQPEVCLDLRSWQEFYGFDKTAREGWFDFDIDVDNLTLTVREAVDKPFFFGKKDDSLIFKPEDAMKELGHVAGPFEKLEGGAVIKIDPREE
ncbi:MAG: right-handed parallel beta-helix repeat-containing protein [Lachnospiraceae bacterium]|nr:right-handed parallel beta-helix repeat-containing protein [Lachnospiraceae bacterium]